MIAKSCDVRDRDWDATYSSHTKYRHKMPKYSQELLFPTLTVHNAVDLDDYKEDLTCNMSLAWKLASRLLKRRPTTGKQNKKCVMVLTPSES